MTATPSLGDFELEVVVWPMGLEPVTFGAAFLANRRIRAHCSMGSDHFTSQEVEKANQPLSLSFRLIAGASDLSRTIG